MHLQTRRSNVNQHTSTAHIRYFLGVVYFSGVGTLPSTQPCHAVIATASSLSEDRFTKRLQLIPADMFIEQTLSHYLQTTISPNSRPTQDLRDLVDEKTNPDGSSAYPNPNPTDEHSISNKSSELSVQSCRICKPSARRVMRRSKMALK